MSITWRKNRILSTVVQSPRSPKSSAIQIRTCNRHNKKTHLTYVFSLLWMFLFIKGFLAKQDLISSKTNSILLKIASMSLRHHSPLTKSRSERAGGGLVFYTQWRLWRHLMRSITVCARRQDGVWKSTLTSRPCQGHNGVACTLRWNSS